MQLISGNFSDGPFTFEENILGGLLTFLGCNPGEIHEYDASYLAGDIYLSFSGFCFCKDAPNVEVDIRQQLIREVMDLCPRGEMNRCLCKDNTKITWPFNLVDLFGCDVKKVQNQL